MKKILMASAIVLLSSFAHAFETCGAVKKVLWKQGTNYTVELSGGRSLTNVILDENAHPYIVAALTNDLIVCFYLTGLEYKFSAVIK